jgi:hypothetical protein
MQRLHQLTPKLAGFAQSLTVAEDQELPTVAYAHVLGLRLCCLIFTAGHTRRARNVAVLINEVQELIIAINRVLHHHFGLAIARLGLLANIAILVEEVEVLAVIALQPEFIDLFRHAALDGPGSPPDASGN